MRELIKTFPQIENNTNFKEQESSIDSEDLYHFKELAEIEPSIEKIVEQLKDKIESGEYDALISDDIGGRIPTLIFREIIKEKGPNKKVNAYFISAGHSLPGRSYFLSPYDLETDYFKRDGKKDKEKASKGGDILIAYIKRMSSNIKKALLVSEKLHSGKTLIGLSSYLEAGGVKNFDIACIDLLHGLREDYMRRSIPNHQIYHGNHYVPEEGSIYERRKELGGVVKPKGKYKPTPRRIIDVIKLDGRDQFISYQEWKEIFGIEKGDSIQTLKEKQNDPRRNQEYEERASKELSQEEIRKINSDIKKAREDVKIMVRRIIQKVWGDY